MSLPLQRHIQEVRGGAFLADKNAGTSWGESGRSPGSHQVNVSLWFLVVVAYNYNLWKYRIYSSIMYFIKSTRIRTCQIALQITPISTSECT